jgi:glycosyltransferase involved in cell wall biosynthesis
MVGDMSRSPVDLADHARVMGISDRVIFHEAVPHEALPAYYALGADGRGVYALTSAYEGIPRVLYEAGSAALPVVAFDVMGVNEAIRDGENGYLIHDGDLDGFADRIVELLDDPMRARQLGVRGREFALELFDAETYPARWVGLWQEAVRLGKKAVST